MVILNTIALYTLGATLISFIGYMVAGRLKNKKVQGGFYLGALFLPMLAIVLLLASGLVNKGAQIHEKLQDRQHSEQSIQHGE